MILSEFQKQFVQAMVSSQKESALPDGIRPGGRLANASAVLDVHREGYKARLLEALGETFEATWWALGDDDFLSLGSRYIDAYPSASKNLSDYGEGFPKFLSSEEEELPFIVELAQFEWVFKGVFHELQHRPLKAENFAQIEAHPSVKFRFGSSCRLLQFSYKVYDLWTLREKESVSEEELEIEGVQRIILYKRNSKIYIERLDAVQFEILADLFAEVPLDVALEKVSENAAASVKALFSFLVRSGCVEKLY